MFWAGLAIAFLSGLAGIGLSRDSIKNRFRWVRNLHFDWVALVLLCCGLLVSTIDHINAAKQIAELEEVSNRVQSFVIDFDIQFTSNWKDAPPKSPRIIVLGDSPVSKIDIALKEGEIRTLDLYIDRDPSFGPSSDGWVHTYFRVKAEPGSWIVGIDARELVEIRKLLFLAYGVRLQDSHDGIFDIGAKSRVFINGIETALLEFNPQKALLTQLPLGDKSPEMSFIGHWVIHPN